MGSGTRTETTIRVSMSTHGGRWVVVHNEEAMFTAFTFLSFPSSVADGGRFNSKQLGLRIQKKVIGKFANKTTAKAFIDDNLSTLLDTLHTILAKEMDSKKADKVIKNIIKVTVKIGLLHKNNQFNQEEIAIGMKFRTKLRQAALTVISFHEVDFTYDRTFIIKVINDCGEMLHQLVERHLTSKSHQRITNVIQSFGNPAILDKVFLSDGPYHQYLEGISQGFHTVVDAEW